MKVSARLHLRSSIALTVFFTLMGSASARATDWDRAVLECWNDSESNSTLRCAISGGQLRLLKSPHDCIINAVRSARAGNPPSARGWMKACVCGDSQVSKEIDAAGQDAVDYVVEHFGSFVD